MEYAEAHPEVDSRRMGASHLRGIPDWLPGRGRRWPTAPAGADQPARAAAVSSLSRVFCRPASSKFSGASHRS